MVGISEKEAFSRRLNLALDMLGVAPGYGRVAELKSRVNSVLPKKVSGEAVRKWLNGDSMPHQDKINLIADSALGVRSEWLMFGKGGMVGSSGSDSGEDESHQSIDGHSIEGQPKKTGTRGLSSRAVKIAELYESSDPEVKSAVEFILEREETLKKRVASIDTVGLQLKKTVKESTDKENGSA